MRRLRKTMGIAVWLGLAANAAMAEPGEIVQIIRNPRTTTQGFPTFLNMGFGVSVAVAGENLLIGSFHDDGQVVGDNKFEGAAYLFNGKTGKPLLTLYQTYPGLQTEFGSSVAANGSVFLVGAESLDRAYAFDGDPLSPNFGGLLYEFQHPREGASCGFGSSVALMGDSLVIADRCSALSGVFAGEVFVFDGDTASSTFGEWIYSIPNVEPDYGDQFGYEIATIGGVLAIGDHQSDDYPESNGHSVGVAYMIDASKAKTVRIDNPTWDPDAPNFSGRFGLALVGVGDDLLLAGHFYDGMIGEGSAHIFEADSASPAFGQHLATIQNPYPGYGDEFGLVVGSAGKKMLIASRSRDAEPPYEDVVYLFEGDRESPDFGELLMTIDNPTPEAGAEERGAGFGAFMTGFGNNYVIADPLQGSVTPGAGAVYIYEGLDAVKSVSLASHTIPAQMIAGQELFVGVTFENTGETLWNAKGDYKLSLPWDTCDMVNDADFPMGYIPDPPGTPPGEGDKTRPREKKQFVFKLKAHELTGCCCRLEFQMMKGQIPFGERFKIPIEIVDPPNATSSAWTAYE